jgi:hypothetical protein
LAAICTAVVAVWALLRQESLSRKQARPVLIPSVELRSEPTRLNFCVENYGPSAAFNVELTFDDAALWELADMPQSLQDLIAMFGQPVPTWAPGQRAETLYSWAASMPPEGDFEKIPVRFTGRIAYRSDLRPWYGVGRVRFTERFTLSTELWHEAMPAPGYSDSVKGHLKRIADSTTAIVAQLRK